MKILIVTGVFPPDIGGPATYVPQVASALHDKGHKVTVVTLSDKVSSEEKGYSFQVVRIRRRMLKPIRLLFTVGMIVKLGREADVLFVNGLALETTVANLVLKKPIIIKVVGDFAWERSRSKGWVEDDFEKFQERHYGFKVELLRALRSWWIRRANKVIVPSQYLAKKVSGWNIPEKKIKVIYNALNIPNQVHSVKIHFPRSFKVVTVGRLTPWKGVDKLIEVIAKIENVGLIVVGEGPERENLKQRAKRIGVSKRIYFAGQCSKEETLALIAAGDVFVLNSTYEGLPHVVLEAMSLGLPVVATAVGGTPEVVKEGYNGRLIPPSDTEYLYNVLLELISSPSELKRLAEGR